MATLRAVWSEVAAGDGVRIALVVGEAGIGKSRLARELALEAREPGAVVLHGSANEDLVVPYQPFVVALRHYLASLRRTSSAVGCSLVRPSWSRSFRVSRAKSARSG